MFFICEITDHQLAHSKDELTRIIKIDKVRKRLTETGNEEVCSGKRTCAQIQTSCYILARLRLCVSVRNIKNKKHKNYLSKC